MNPAELIILSGAIGKDAEMTYQERVKSNVLQFDLAVNNNYTNSQTGDRVNTQSWYTIQIFIPKKKPTQLLSVLKKGTIVSLAGSPRLRVWMNQDQKPEGRIFVTAKSQSIKILTNIKTENPQPFDQGSSHQN